jgi:hypothetical protein
VVVFDLLADGLELVRLLAASDDSAADIGS